MDGADAVSKPKRLRGVPDPVEVFRDEYMSSGHDHDDLERTLHFAMKALSTMTASAWVSSSKTSAPSRLWVFPGVS